MVNVARRTVLLRLCRCLLLVSTVSAAALVYPTPAQASWDGFDDFTYASQACTGWGSDLKDPINYYFNTTNHRLGEYPFAWHVIQGWPVYWTQRPTPASNQYFWSTNSGCHMQDDQLAEFVAGPKYHTRLRQGPWIPGWGYATATPMHHDSWVININCGLSLDVADSFNSARNFAYGKFRDAGFSQGHYWVGNTRAIQQCDGRMTASDGYVWENHGY